MTTLHVLGSGSKGNCCAVTVGGETLLVDAGFSAREIVRRAALMELDLGSVRGVVVTHEHGDHARGAVRLALQLGVPLIGSAGTLAALSGASTHPREVLSITAPLEIGSFLIHAAATGHDAAEPLAVVVETVTGSRVGYATDLGRPSTGLRWLFRQLTAVVLEANYDEVLLRTGGYPASVQQRIAGFGGHLSNGGAADLLRELHHPGMVAVVLAHLSQRCNTPAHARARVEPGLREAGFVGRFEVAGQEEPLGPIVMTAEAGALVERAPV